MSKLIEEPIPVVTPPAPVTRPVTRIIQIAVAAIIGAIIAWFVLAPLGSLLYEAVWNGESFSLKGIADAFSAFGIGPIFRDSFIFAAATALVAIVQSTLMAWLAARTDAPFQRLLFAAAVVPLIIPPVLSTLAWIYLGSPNTGMLNVWAQDIFGGPIVDIFSMGGMVFVESQHLVPLVFLLLYAALKSTDPSLEESALMSGASRFTVLRRITLPLIAPAIFASVIILVVRSLEAFEVPALLGLPKGIVVFTSRIWRALNNFPADTATATAYSLIVLVICVVGMAFYGQLAQRNSKSFQTVTGKGFRSATLTLGRWRWFFGVLIAFYFVIAVVLPSFVLVYSSFQPYYRPPTWDTITTSTLSNYQSLFQNQAIIVPFQNSMILALGTATVLILVMSVVAWVIYRTKLPGRTIIDGLVTLPLGIPGIVLGFAMLGVYIGFPIPVYGTLWILFIAYLTRFMPYGLRYVSTSLLQIGVELEESARMSGASWFQIFRRILLPLMLPGLLAGWIYIVTVSLRELSSSLLLYSPGTEVLSIAIWEMWSNGGFTVVAALGVLMTIGLLVLILIARRLTAKQGLGE